MTRSFWHTGAKLKNGALTRPHPVNLAPLKFSFLDLRAQQATYLNGPLFVMLFFLFTFLSLFFSSFSFPFLSFPFFFFGAPLVKRGPRPQCSPGYVPYLHSFFGVAPPTYCRMFTPLLLSMEPRFQSILFVFTSATLRCGSKKNISKCDNSGEDIRIDQTEVPSEG